MYAFESLYFCDQVRIIDGRLVLDGVFTVWERKPAPFVLLARVSGGIVGVDIRYEVKLVRLDADMDQVWSGSFHSTPPGKGGRPVELTAIIRGGELFPPGVYVAMMVLHDGLQASGTFRVK